MDQTTHAWTHSEATTWVVYRADLHICSTVSIPQQLYKTASQFVSDSWASCYTILYFRFTPGLKLTSPTNHSHQTFVYPSVCLAQTTQLLTDIVQLINSFIMWFLFFCFDLCGFNRFSSPAFLSSVIYFLIKLIREVTC